MAHQIINHTYSCDFCESIMDESELVVSEEHTFKFNISIDVWHGPRYAADHICRRCQREIGDTIGRLQGGHLTTSRLRRV
jgi:hypothetical protein